MTLGAEEHEQMFRFSGQPTVKPPKISSQASLVLTYRPTKGSEQLSRPCPAWGLNNRPVAWKRDTLPLDPLSFSFFNRF
ncbi:hypothetical protein TNCV_1568101 [Trichonephila clavipes]|nr:hypothetical protein TNCV_1568101 [Trichonephila clavipes]